MYNLISQGCTELSINSKQKEFCILQHLHYRLMKARQVIYLRTMDMIMMLIINMSTMRNMVRIISIKN